MHEGVIMDPGFYWAKYSGKIDSHWEFVEVHKDHKGNDRVCYFGTDFDEPPSQFTTFVKADLIDPDGNPYYNSGDGYEGN